MGYSKVLARLRGEHGLTQAEAADFLSRHSKKRVSPGNVSHWETGIASPSIEQFLLLCELYGVRDIQETFRGVLTGYRDFSKLSALGKSRASEYIAMLLDNPLFAESVREVSAVGENTPRYIRLYDIPAAAGHGVFLDSDAYEEIEADDTVPEEADFALRVSGDSMTPRFVDGQMIFISGRETLGIGEIGVFALNGDAYVKRLGRGELVSLNGKYAPIPIGEYDSFHIFGKAVG